jgi:hypothetical protein
MLHVRYEVQNVVRVTHEPSSAYRTEGEVFTPLYGTLLRNRYCGAIPYGAE